jgi:hypothetical protein
VSDPSGSKSDSVTGEADGIRDVCGNDNFDGGIKDGVNSDMMDGICDDVENCENVDSIKNNKSHGNTEDNDNDGDVTDNKSGGSITNSTGTNNTSGMSDAGDKSSDGVGPDNAFERNSNASVPLSSPQFPATDFDTI